MNILNKKGQFDSFRLQDTLLIMSALVLFVSFTATFVFQLGLIHIVLFQFLPTVIVAILYISISIGYHYASLVRSSGQTPTTQYFQNTTWNDQSLNIFLSNYFLLAFFTFHKVVSCIFYSYYKRTALQISDPKYNSDSAWLRELFLKHMEDKIAKEAVTATNN